MYLDVFYKNNGAKDLIMRRFTLSIAMLLTMSITVTGCTSYDSVQLRKEQVNNSYTYYQVSPPLYSGDVVKYRLKNGNQNTITVQRTTAQGIITNTGDTLLFNDIVSLERKDISKGKTAAAVGAGVGATAVVVIAVFAVAIGAGFAAVLSGA